MLFLFCSLFTQAEKGINYYTLYFQFKSCENLGRMVCSEHDAIKELFRSFSTDRRTDLSTGRIAGYGVEMNRWTDGQTN